MEKAELLVRILRDAKSELLALKNGREIVRQGGAFGDSKNDTELSADQVIGQYLMTRLRKEFDDPWIAIEGLADDYFGNLNGTLITVDPLDGSLNYSHAGQMTGFPVTAVITMFCRQTGVLFRDVTAAAVIDLRHCVQDSWAVSWHLEEERYWTRTSNGQGFSPYAKTMDVQKLDLGRMNVIGECTTRRIARSSFGRSRGRRGGFGRLGQRPMKWRPWPAVRPWLSSAIGRSNTNLVLATRL